MVNNPRLIKQNVTDTKYIINTNMYTCLLHPPNSAADYLKTIWQKVKLLILSKFSIFSTLFSNYP